MAHPTGPVPGPEVQGLKSEPAWSGAVTVTGRASNLNARPGPGPAVARAAGSDPMVSAVGWRDFVRIVGCDVPAFGGNEPLARISHPAPYPYPTSSPIRLQFNAERRHRVRDDLKQP